MTMSACGPDSIPEPSVSLIPAGSVKGFRFEHYNKATNSVFFLYTTQDASYLSGKEWIEYSKAKVQSLTDYLRENGGVFTVAYRAGVIDGLGVVRPQGLVNLVHPVTVVDVAKQARVGYTIGKGNLT